MSTVVSLRIRLAELFAGRSQRRRDRTVRAGKLLLARLVLQQKSFSA